MSRRDELIAALRDRVHQYEAGDRDVVLSQAAADEANELMGRLPPASQPTDVESATVLAWFNWCRGRESGSPETLRASTILFRRILAVDREAVLPADIDVLFAAQELAQRLTPDTAMDFAREASRRGDMDSLNWVIIVLSEAEALSRESGVSADCAVYAYLFGQQLADRYRLIGHASDLDASVDAQRRALGLVTHDNPSLVAAMHGELGTALLLRYQERTGQHDLDAAVNELRHAHQLLGPGEPKWFWLTLNLGSALFLAADYPTAEEVLAGALAEYFDGGVDAAMLRVTLGRVRCRLYRTRHLRDDLDAGIRELNSAYMYGLQSSAQDAVRIRDDAATLLASALFDYYELDNELRHLDEAARLLTERLELATTESARIGALYALSEMYLRRFHCIGEADALTAAISTADEVRHLSGPDADAAISICPTLADALSERYRVRGDVHDLDRAVDIASEGKRSSSGDSFISCLLALGHALTLRASAAGSRDDATGAIQALTTAIDQMPAGSLQRQTALTRLGNAFATRARLFGGAEDVAAAIDAFRQAAAEGPSHHVLEGLASALISRAELRYGVGDLNEAIAHCQEAARIAPEHNRYTALYLLATALGVRASRNGDQEDREAAITAGTEALQTMPQQHGLRPNCLSNLASAYSSRSGEHAVHDLDKAIDLLREAIRILPRGHGQRMSLLANLASTLTDRFARTANVADFEAAVEQVDLALAECPAERAERPQLHYLRAKVYLNGANGLPAMVAAPYRATAVAELRRAADAPLASPVLRVVALRTLAESATDPAASLRNYEEIIPLVPLLVSPELGRTEREELLAELKSTFRDAVAAALDADQPERAVELLEYSRSIYWSQTAAPDLDLQPPRYADLSSAATEGALVLINIAQRRSDALALTPEGLRVISLEKATPADVETHVSYYIDALANMEIDGATRIFGAQADEMRAAEMIGSREGYLDHVGPMVKVELEWLWETVAEPVLKKLGHIATPTDGSWPRIWWCPTGVLAHLPLHAAGRYWPNAAAGQTVMDRVVSSYIPSLRALTAARRRPPSSGRVLLVAMPETPGLPALPTAGEDIEILPAGFGAETTIITGSDASREAVCTALREHSWVHFTCHGVFEPLDPVHSGLRLHNETLTVADILELRLENAELAFLSSCNTAVSGYRLPDDPVSLSAQVSGDSR